MKSFLLFGLCLILSIGLSAQIKFEQGYVITDKNERIECLIKNISWKSSPKSIEYRLTENSEIKVLDISEFNEFEIYNESKYKKFEVEIDRDEFTDERNQISKNKDPQFKKEIILLKYVTEGYASLFSFNESNVDKFFYATDTSQVKQLIYKRYIKLTHQVGELVNEHYDVNKSMVIYTNYEYKNQLLNDLKCEGITQKSVEQLKYNQKELLHFFDKYNACKNSKRIDYTKKNGNLINVYLQGGISYTQLQLYNLYKTNFDVDIVFDYEIAFRYGFELEYILPYKKKKWAFSVSPAFISYNTEKHVDYMEYGVIPREVNVTAEYNEIEIPIGLKYYMYLGDKSKIDFNASVITAYSFNSLIDSDSPFLHDLVPGIKGINYQFGVGYVFANALSLDIKYRTNNTLMGAYSYWDGHLNTISMTLGFNIMSLFYK
jgi:hypothetical protein